MPLKLNSSGGGSVTLDVPSTASTFTATVPANSGTLVTTGSTAAVTQAMLASGVAGNGPAFRVRLFGDQTVTNGVTTKVTLNSEIFDTANCFDSTTNYRFTPNVAGYYQFNVTQGASASSSLNYNYILISKNGTTDSIAIYGPYGNVASYGALSALIYLNGTTDYVELYAQLSGSGTLQLVGSSAAIGTYLSGSLVRAA